MPKLMKNGYGNGHLNANLNGHTKNRLIQSDILEPLLSGLDHKKRVQLLGDKLPVASTPPLPRLTPPCRDGVQ
jgi:hypothetical protein